MDVIIPAPNNKLRQTYSTISKNVFGLRQKFTQNRKIN